MKPNIVFTTEFLEGFTGTQEEIDGIVKEIETYFSTLPSDVQEQCKDIVFHGKFDEIDFGEDDDEIDLVDDFILPQRTLH